MSGSPGANQAAYSLEEVRLATGAIGEGSGSVLGVTSDSRAVTQGSLFLALKGEKFDGHDYVSTAEAAGAAAVLVSSPVEASIPVLAVPDTLMALGDLARFHRRRFEIPLVGITGSYGKTTTRALIHAALNSGLATLTSQANFNNEIGLPLTLLQLESGHQAAVLEMGMRGLGQIDYLAKVAEPTVGVITNVGPQHVELLGSVENIASAKSELLRNLPGDGLAVLPADSPYLEYLLSQCHCRWVTFGTSPNANYRVKNLSTETDGGIRFEVILPAGKALSVRLIMPGAHNAVNAAAALAVAVELGLNPEAAAEALSRAEVPGARMRVFRLEDGTVLIDDCYNAGPDSMKAALGTLSDFPGSGRRVAILGAMKELGAEEEFHHQVIGRLAGQMVEVLVGVGGETRPMLNAAVASARQVENELLVSYCDVAGEAAERVEELVRPGDIVLIKGSRSVGLEVVVEKLRGGSLSP